MGIFIGIRFWSERYGEFIFDPFIGRLIAMKGRTAEDEVAALSRCRDDLTGGALPQLAVRIDTFALPTMGDLRSLVVLEPVENPQSLKR